MRDLKSKLEHILEDVIDIKTDIAEIKVDLRHHIKRSDQHEHQILGLSKVKERIYGIVGFLGLLGTILALKGFLR